MLYIATLCVILFAAAEGSTWGRQNAWETLQSTASFSSFANLISTFPSYVSQLQSSEGELTLFAPTNMAIQESIAFLEGLSRDDLGKVIGYHFVRGMGMQSIGELETGRLMTTEYLPEALQNQAQKVEVYKDSKTRQVWVGGDLHFGRIIVRNLRCTNAMIHGISQVLIPPANVVETARQFSAAKQLPHGLSMWLKAVDFTGLANKLANAQGVTVLPPTDCAFQRLGNAAIQFLFSDRGRSYLEKIVSYHVIMTTDYYDGKSIHGQRSIETALGKTIEVEKSEAGTMINGRATVIYSDLLCQNGVMHLLDSVLLPFKIPVLLK